VSNLFRFTPNFGSEEFCELHFKKGRDEIRAECKCGCKEHFWVKSRCVINVKNVEAEHH
jgi:hypothetical protein